MNKQSGFIQECIRKFISKDIPSKLMYNNNYVAENCNKREDYMLEDVIVWVPQILKEKLLLYVQYVQKSLNYCSPFDGNTVRKITKDRALFMVYTATPY